MKPTRWGAALLVTGLALGLAACSTGAEETGDVTLTLWDPGLLSKSTEDGKVDTDKSFIHQAAALYEEQNPGVKIEIVQTSGDTSADGVQFQAASIAGDGPDIRVGFAGGNTLSFEDFLLDLDGTFSDETVADIKGWNTVKADYKSDGAQLALPYGGGSYFYVFYNKEMIDAAGIDLSTPPESWEDLLDLGDEVKKTGETPFWVANQEGYVGAWVIAALAGGELGPDAFTDMYNGEIAVDDPAMVKAYEAFHELYDRGLTNPDAGSVGNADALSGFVQGNGAFYISGAWENAQMNDAMGDNVGVFAIPRLEGAKYPDTVAGGPNVAVSITNYSKHTEQAQDFLRFLAEPSTIDLYVKLFQVEASNSASADESVITNPLLQSEAEQLKSAETVYPFDNVMPQSVIELFYKVNAQVFTGAMSAEDGVAQLQAAYDAEQ